MPQPILYHPTDENRLIDDIHRTPIEGLYYVGRMAHKDDRGFYSEIARLPEIEEVTGHPFHVRQMNLSYSKLNVVRGFHAENWNKLLTIIEGRCFCAWTDLRPASPTFGQAVTMWVGHGENAYFGSMYVSSGIGNSFCVTDGPVYYLYAVDELYKQRDASGDLAISLFDQDINVEWPLARSTMVISQRDEQSITLREKFPEKF